MQISECYSCEFQGSRNEKPFRSLDPVDWSIVNRWWGGIKGDYVHGAAHCATVQVRDRVDPHRNFEIPSEKFVRLNWKVSRSCAISERRFVAVLRYLSPPFSFIARLARLPNAKSHVCSYIDWHGTRGAGSGASSAEQQIAKSERKVHEITRRAAGQGTGRRRGPEGPGGFHSGAGRSHIEGQYPQLQFAAESVVKLLRGVATNQILQNFIPHHATSSRDHDCSGSVRNVRSGPNERTSARCWPSLLENNYLRLFGFVRDASRCSNLDDLCFRSHSILCVTETRVRRSTEDSLPKVFYHQRVPQPDHAPNFYQASSGAHVGHRDSHTGVCHVQCFFPGTANKAVPDPASPPIDSSEKHIGACRWGRQRDWPSQPRPVKALSTLLEHSQSLPTRSRLHRYGEHADYGMHGVTSSLHSQQIMRSLIAFESDLPRARVYAPRIRRIVGIVNAV